MQASPPDTLTAPAGADQPSGAPAAPAVLVPSGPAAPPPPLHARAELPLRWMGAALLATVACLAALPWISSREADATMTQLTQVATEERGYDNLLGLLKDAETGQRGYIITGNRAFLDPYDKATAAIPVALQGLQAAADSPQERAALNTIRALSDQRLGLLAAGIRTRDAGGIAAAAQAVSRGEGKLLMDRLRALIGARLATLADDRGTLRARMGTTLGYASALGLAVSLATALVICAALYIAMRGLRERGEAAEQARRLAAAEAGQARRAEEQNQRLAGIAGMLQAMDSLLDAAELADVLPAFLPKLLPGSSGAVYLYRSSRDFLQRCAAWGGAGDHPDLVTAAQCWALRFGRPHLVRDSQDLYCGHCGPDARAQPGCEHLCVPMISQGEVLGLLVATVPAGPGAAADQAAVGAIAEQLALGTSNIDLRALLRRQSTTDELTGLYNRRYFDEALRRELFRAERTRAPLAVVMIDLDHFKRINDTHGHDAGDAVLRACGRCVHDSVRRSDIACRYGGEELVLVLPECDLAAAVRCAGTLGSAIAALRPAHGDVALPAVTASIGVAAWPEHGLDAAALLQAADRALYAAKHGGRDRVCTA